MPMMKAAGCIAAVLLLVTDSDSVVSTTAEDCDLCTHYFNGDTCVATLICTPGQYTHQAATSTTDRICYNCESENSGLPLHCDYGTTAGTYYESRPCLQDDCTNGTSVGSTNRQCARKTVCTASEYESVASTPTSDRECADATDNDADDTADDTDDDDDDTEASTMLVVGAVLFGLGVLSLAGVAINHNCRNRGGGSNSAVINYASMM